MLAWERETRITEMSRFFSYFSSLFLSRLVSCSCQGWEKKSGRESDDGQGCCSQESDLIALTFPFPAQFKIRKKKPQLPTDSWRRLFALFYLSRLYFINTLGAQMNFARLKICAWEKGQTETGYFICIFLPSLPLFLFRFDIHIASCGLMASSVYINKFPFVTEIAGSTMLSQPFKPFV